MKNNKIEAYDDFFKLLSDKFKEIKIINSKFKNTYDLYNICCKYNKTNDTYMCYQAKIENLLKNKKGKKDFKNLLIEVLGPNFFNHSKEEQDILEEQNIATSKMMPVIFKDAIGFKYENIKIPKNYDELIKQIENILEILNNNQIDEKEQEKYARPLVIIENIIASRYKEFLDSYNNQLFVIKNLNNIFNLYNNKKEIKMDDNFKLLKDILNKNIEYTITHEDKTMTNKDIGFGDVVFAVIEDYNKDINEKQKAKEHDKELRKRINNYYKDLVNTPIDVMKNSQFPLYSDKDVVELYEGLIKKLDDACSKNEELFSLLSITQLMYGQYFQSKYYFDANEKQKVK